MFLSTRNGKIYKLKSLISKPELFIDLGEGKGYIRQLVKYNKEYFILTENEACSERTTVDGLPDRILFFIRKINR